MEMLELARKCNHVSENGSDAEVNSRLMDDILVRKSMALAILFLILFPFSAVSESQYVDH